MLKHIPFTTRIFIGLFIITMLLTYLALALTLQFNNSIYDSSAIQINIPKKHKPVAVEPEIKLLDTKNWPVFTDKTYPISFHYPKGWTVTQSTPANQTGFADITIKPSDKSPNFHISISKKSYLGLDGLKQDPYKLGDNTGVMVNNNLIGVKSGEYYYTFDGSLNSQKIAEFKTLMSTVNLQKTAPLQH